MHLAMEMSWNVEAFEMVRGKFIGADGSDGKHYNSLCCNYL